MDHGTDRTAEIATPALLRAARTTYGTAMRDALGNAGYDDVPRNGLYVIGALAHSNAPLAQIIRELGVSKQAAGQLIDTLVLRGYLERSVDPGDRRRLIVMLTERGRAAADVQRSAMHAIDAELLRHAGAQCVAHMRQALLMLAHLGTGSQGE